MMCLIGRNLTEYDYLSMSRDHFVPISVKSTINATQLANDVV
jgi:hypothetical protein